MFGDKVFVAIWRLAGLIIVGLLVINLYWVSETKFPPKTYVEKQKWGLTKRNHQKAFIRVREKMMS